MRVRSIRRYLYLDKQTILDRDSREKVFSFNRYNNSHLVLFSLKF